ncbi:hypothetical protein TNCT_418651 [Trichonephila clavata]|uniref:Uncharacterized protein n=1 Tax=Trichonephila clavata TaxID=2740835 RepID=A0A8X6KAY1_TRICU|nr:hypothetical protein TNCT_418651 [Trichonephila clavata]
MENSLWFYCESIECSIPEVDRKSAEQRPDIPIFNISAIINSVPMSVTQILTPPGVGEDFLNDCSEWVLPSELTVKLDVYCSIRNTTSSAYKTAHLKEYSSKSYDLKISSPDSRTNQAGSTLSFNRGDKWKTEDISENTSVFYYGCGTLGVKKPRCLNFKPTAKQTR